MSLFKYLGVGTVTATKDTDTNEVMVYVPSLFPQAEGRMTAVAEKVERKSLNAYNEEVRSVSLKSNSIPAIWKKMDDSNRITAPDVREGSTVAVYQIEGQNTYYWTLDGVNPNTFRTETVMYGWNANPHVAENGEFDVDNFYMLNIDTRSGLVQFRTSKANGEATTFDIQVNTEAGTINIGSENSMFNIDDVNQTLTYQNQEGSTFRVDKKTATLHVPDSFNVFADKVFNLKTKEINIQAETANIDIGLTKWKGRIERTGDTSMLGDYDQTGKYDQKGNYNHTGDVNRTGNSVSTGTVIGLTDVRTATVSLNFHFHAGVENGRGVTTPPVPM